MTLRVGIVGTSWWADSMFLPALADHPVGRVMAVCGRNRERAEALAAAWDVPHAFTDWPAMLGSGEIDAVIVAATNDTHEPVTVAALDAGLHVLCDKPIAITASAARAMADRAAGTGLTTMVPYTYRYMPVFRAVKQRVDDGFVGRPFHLSMRYFAQFGTDPAWAWRFDGNQPGAGLIADLGSHWLHVARWLCGEVDAVGATAGRHVDHEPAADGTPSAPVEDSAVITVRFVSGAYGVLHISSVWWNGTEFGQTHHLELCGSNGTVSVNSDWEEVQELRALAMGEPGPAPLVAIPDDVWGGVRRDRVPHTYRDVFRTTEAMTREWATAASEGRPVQPDLAEGARVQELVEAAQRSATTDGRLLLCRPTEPPDWEQQPPQR